MTSSCTSRSHCKYRTFVSPPLCRQLYLPDTSIMNKDFIKEILSGEKNLLKMSDVKSINAPHYAEVSVTNIYPRIQHDPEVTQYFPSRLPKGRQIDRAYFFNILNTVRPDYLSKIITHAQSLRNTADDPEMRGECIEITPEWQSKLEAVPFVTSKCYTVVMLYRV